MILVFCPESNPRLKYTFDLVLKELLGTEYKFTSDEQAFESYTDCKFSYHDKPLGTELFFYAGSLLFEKGIRDQAVSVFDWEGGKVFFASHPKYVFPFDPFAAIFYLVSRYEEYLPHLRDIHDRYDTTESIAYQKGFLTRPVVNIWALRIKKELLKRYPGYSFPERKYRFISTIDIDNAYAYLEKGFMRTAGAYARSLMKFDFSDLKERTKVLTGFMQDPYDTYDFQLQLQKKYQYRCIYFTLLAEYGENDKNVPPDSKRLRSLIKSLADYSEVGIHPSYGSNSDSTKLKKEVAILSRILKRDVTRSRQHFLILKLPETYRRLLDLDITDDYTMGYALQVGFRASICTPFYFYDLDLEKPTNLRIHPFAVMDATLKYYMKVSPGDAMSYIKPLIDETKAVKGDFVSLWHNESLGDNKLWNGWKRVYEEMVDYAVQ